MDRGTRRSKSERKLKQRLGKMKHWNLDSDRQVGILKNTPTPCSCYLCKPHKYGLEPKYKPSERKYLVDFKD